MKIVIVLAQRAGRLMGEAIADYHFPLEQSAVGGSKSVGTISVGTIREDEVMARELSLSVNGQNRSTTTDEDRPLLDVLREDFHLTGTKYGCGEGECGACTVLIGGVPRRSCLVSVGEVQDEPVETIEGLSEDGPLHPVQQAFLDHHAMQCGYCVPGHIMTAVALARDNPGSSRQEIVSAMSEHICRCCNYSNIRAAVEEAVSRA